MSIIPGPQLSFTGIVLAERQDPTARWAFLQVIDSLLNWTELLAMVEPVYPKAAKGRQPYPLEPLLRLYLLRHWFQISLEASIDLVLDSEAARAFTRIDIFHQWPPGRSTFQRFDQLLRDKTLDSRINAKVTQQVSPLVLRLGELREPKIERPKGGNVRAGVPPGYRREAE